MPTPNPFSGWLPGDPIPETVGEFKQLILQLLEDQEMHWAAHRRSDYNFSNLAQHHPIRLLRGKPTPPISPVIGFPGSGEIPIPIPVEGANLIYNVILSCYNNTENLNSDARYRVTAHDTMGDRSGIQLVAFTSASIFAALGVVGITPTTTSVTIETINIVPHLGTVVGGALYYLTPTSRPVHPFTAAPVVDASNVSPYEDDYTLTDPTRDAVITQAWALRLDSHGLLPSDGAFSDPHQVALGEINVIDHLGTIGTTVTEIGFNQGSGTSDGKAKVSYSGTTGFGVISYGMAGL